MRVHEYSHKLHDNEIKKFKMLVLDRLGEVILL